MSDPFDVIPFEDIKDNWKKLGSGSFGNVYKGSYLGIDVAIKEVLPSNEYDVAKYFEREWRLLKESRHPNVVLYLGLSRAPDPDGRIFIVSEFIENGNLRMYIHDKHKPFPWRLRISFATDIARALAYLHARKCIHRDLKGENLLVTSNGRLKITDFGFARIAARNAEESRRLTFCGTDAYMSPEIMLGNEFDLPTDIFSLGVIFAEIAARRLADDSHFKRTAPSFTIDPDEIRSLVSPGCPPAFVQLAIDCLAEDCAARPTTRAILDRLREIETEILSRPNEADDVHTGSIKFMPTNKRASIAPRIPSFGVGIGREIHNGSGDKYDAHLSEDDSDEEFMDAAMGLQNVSINDDHASTVISHSGESTQPLIESSSSIYSEYSTTVIRSHPTQSTYTAAPSLSSILTIRPAGANVSEPEAEPRPNTASLFSIDSYYTAPSVGASIAAATEGGSTIRSIAPALVHRFTLIKPGAKRRSGNHSPNVASEVGWGPLDFFFTSGLLLGGAKCDICMKRLGRKPVLECDDCGLRTHIACGEVAPRDCGLRPARQVAAQSSSPPTTPSSKPTTKINSPFSLK
ncbi:hypothetical protein EW146_g4321 [Bondarzewia mesenterica]|uniref:Protein kinase domain-containing protein n=1 Tax=Bondarzewia mesenterica TaxID=1095465 RepID=A0A4S4LUU3_9AGAM|nr:hypothetical protein EW146_g4321 [Bondarzewia mesenterica]